MFLSLLAFLSLYGATVYGHSDPRVKQMASIDPSCVENPPYLSYHIHILFWQNNQNSTNAALNLQKAFMDHFSLTYEKDMCPFEPGGTEPTAPMCVFETDYQAAGPFTTAQAAFFIPVSDYEKTVSWIVQRRGKLDIFIHPNSGCSLQDHLQDGLWGGNKWELDPAVFLN